MEEAIHRIPVLRVLNSQYSMRVLNQKGQRIFQCHKCHRIYKHQSSLHRHVQFECDKPPAFMCPIEGCNYKAKQRSSVKSHFFARHMPHYKCELNE
ncbi:longitudinals lacking protein, isoforms A/B/D/L [Coccinella septempunctata]|uniref:longitudinals lacking protein, isoforms A/B/D/L n=1 Tax=Coccinella septempunctata TaxID=41139 RepID=UPI001D07BC54|nr:longitudinals lacking protein, isoforms A/B/D/L [Coccinella septempunctata]